MGEIIGILGFLYGVWGDEYHYSQYDGLFGSIKRLKCVHILCPRNTAAEYIYPRIIIQTKGQRYMYVHRYSLHPLEQKNGNWKF